MTKTYPVRSRLFHLLCREPEPAELPDDYYEQSWWDDHLRADARFLERLPDELSFEGLSVLDYGCGGGHTCVVLAQRGATRVLGVDIGSVEFAEQQVAERHPDLEGRLEFKQIASAADIGDEQFDVVLSKNTFEHVDDPARYVADMASHLAPGGRLVIAFGALWKSPYGGHLQHMTKAPWVHLYIPEPVVLRERRRYRPDEDPSCYEEVKGGLNRMTLAKFQATMRDSGLEPEYLEINRNDRAIAKALNLLRKVPGLGEYFTFSIHSVWTKPEPVEVQRAPGAGTGRAPEALASSRDAPRGSRAGRSAARR
jgi:SAM-dependent methyltransferase